MADKPEKRNFQAEEASRLDNINKLEKSLYSRKQKTFSVKRHSITAGLRQSDTKGDWNHENDEPESVEFNQESKPKMTLSKKIFVGSATFFLIAIVVAVFTLLGGRNVVSNDKVSIQIAGPASIAGGDKLLLEVAIRNENPIALELADLISEYPDGTREAGDLNKELRRKRESVGDILPGQTINRQIEAVLYGEEGSAKTIKLTIEYRVKGSNAIFFKEKLYDLVISSSPVTFKIDAPAEANAGQSIELVVEVVSNSLEPLQNLMLIAEYPFGFSLKSASPETAFGQNIWRLGDLPPQGKKKVKIKGVIDGQDGEERAFKFSVGIQSATNEKEIGAVFLSIPQVLAIRKSFVGLGLTLNSSADGIYIGKDGQLIRGDLVWQNNTAGTISNLQIEAVFSGQAIDRSSVTSESGFFRSIDNTIVWDGSRNQDLLSIDPGSKDNLSFSFSSLPAVSGFGTPLKNPEITLTISAKATRVSQDNQLEEINSTITRKVRVASNPALISRLLYYSGPFVNTGSLPPKAEQETTYTVIWSLSNPANDLSEVKVSTILPSYVRFIGTIDPTDAKVSFSQIGGEVVWDVGNLSAGSGFDLARKEVAFQVGFLPSLSQVGGAPKITEEVFVSAIDSFTNTSVRDGKSALTTRLVNDPLFKSGDDTVVK